MQGIQGSSSPSVDCELRFPSARKADIEAFHACMQAMASRLGIEDLARFAQIFCAGKFLHAVRRGLHSLAEQSR